MINKRIFSANVGDTSTGQAGPDAIEQDLDNLFANDQELSLKVIWKALNYKTELDKPSAYPNEQVTVFVTTQAWQGVANLIIRTEKYNNNVAIQYLQPNGSLITPVMYRLAIPDLDTWAAWERIATNKQPNWITGTLQGGWTGSFQYRKNQFGQLEYRFNIKAGTVGSFTQILVLPLEYRTVATPNGNVWFDIPLVNISTADKAYLYYDGGNGTICVSPVVPFTTGSSFAGAGVIPLG